MTVRQHGFTRAEVRGDIAAAWFDDEIVDVINVWPIYMPGTETTELWIETVRKDQPK